MQGHTEAYACIEPDDPLETDSEQTAIGVVNRADDLIMAIGDDSKEEWIRIEGMNTVPVER
jgi:hypothetical protein